MSILFTQQDLTLEEIKLEKLLDDLYCDQENKELDIKCKEQYYVIQGIKNLLT